MARRKYNYRQETLLKRRLKLTLTALVVTVIAVFISLQFFGPKIGAFFLLLSKNRNTSGPVDNIPPPAPIFSRVPKATKEEAITLNGITEAGATVEIFVNGPKKGKTTADNDGAFTFIDVEMGRGNNIVFAKAIDENNNESEKSKVFTIVFDNKEPEIEITTPQNGAEIKNLNRRILVQGKLNEEAEVKINGRQAIVRSDNSFELLLGVDEGDVQIKVVATDLAQNTTEEVIYVKYSKES